MGRVRSCHATGPAVNRRIAVVRVSTVCPLLDGFLIPMISQAAKEMAKWLRVARLGIADPSVSPERKYRKCQRTGL